jgi:GTP cyclohydrolase I
MQERMSREIAAELESRIGATGVAVRAEAAHLCTRMRGVREAEAITCTSVWRGRYEENAALRAEFLALCNRG